MNADHEPIADLVTTLPVSSASTGDDELSRATGIEDRVHQLVRKARPLFELGENWDSYGGVPLQRHLLEFGLPRVVAHLPADAPLPEICPTSRGGFQLEWSTERLDVEVLVERTASLAVYFDDHETGEEDEFTVTTDVRRLREVLARLGAS